MESLFQHNNGIDSVTFWSPVYHFNWQNQETNEKAAIEQEEDNNGIDWSDTVLVEHPNKGGVAKGSDALTVLDNPKTRVIFMDDLMEVKYLCVTNVSALNYKKFKTFSV